MEEVKYLDVLKKVHKEVLHRYDSVSGFINSPLFAKLNKKLGITEGSVRTYLSYSDKPNRERYNTSSTFIAFMCKELFNREIRTEIVVTKTQKFYIATDLVT